LIKASLGTIWGQNTLWVQLGNPKEPQHSNHLIQPMPRGSPWLSHLSSQVPRDTLPLVHVSKWAPPRHKSPDRWAPPQCHVAVIQWSTSPNPMPHGTTTSSHLNPAVPHDSISSHHITSICHMAAYHEATSLFEIQQLDTWQHQSEPPQQLSATWHFLIGSPHHCGLHHTIR
jgi:hypothetical protein